MSRWSSSSTSSVETIGGEVEQVHHRHHLQDGKEIVETRVKSPNDHKNTDRENRKYSGEKSEKTRKLTGKEKRSSSPDGSRDKKYQRHSKDSDDRHSGHKHRDSHDKSYDKRKYSDKEKKYHDSENENTRKPHHHHHHHRHSLESDIKNKNYSDENDTLDKGIQIQSKGHRHHRRHHTRHYIDKGRLLPPAPPLTPVPEVEKRIIHVKDDTTSVSRVIKRESLVNQNQTQTQNPLPSCPIPEPPEEKVKIIHVKDDTTSVSRVLTHKSSVVTPECPVCPVKSNSKQQLLLSSESEPETETNRKIYPTFSESEPDVEFFSSSNSPDTDTSQKRETFSQSQADRKAFIRPNSDPRNFISTDSERRNFISSDAERRNFISNNSDPRNFISSDAERKNFISNNSDPRNFITSDSERRNFISPDSERAIFNTGESDASYFIPPESQRSIFMGEDLESRRDMSDPTAVEMPSSSIHSPPFSEDVVVASVHRETSVVSETQEENFHQAKVGELQEGDTCPECGRGKILKKFTWTGIIAAILLFPCGIYCCFKCRALKCSYCGATPI